jgi:4'-phosphopantetheinyl transferase EntD
MAPTVAMTNILPEGISVCELTGTSDPDPLYLEEEAFIRFAVLKRRREFALSRTCARRALTKLGIAPGPILSAPNRAPIWPPGVIGSITHCDSYTAAAVCWDDQLRSLGIDAEINQPLPEGVLALITSPGEQVTLNRLLDPVIHWDRLLFSAKESMFKAWFPVARRWLDFLEAEVTIDPVNLTFRGELLVESPPTGSLLEGRFRVSGSHLLTAVALSIQ